MADLGAASWSEIDASNNATPPDGWPEGQEPSTVNNCARSQMGGEKRWYDRSNSTQTTTGTLTAYVLTYASTQAALYDGFETSFILDQACGAAATLNIDGLGARTMRKYDLATSAFIAIAAGDFLANQVLRVRYNLAASSYDVISASFWPGAFPTVFSPINLLNALNEGAVTMGAAPTMNIGAGAGNYIHVVSNFSAVVTITIASPAVIGATAHGLLAGAAGSFATTGALPTGLSAATTYYVINPTTNTFQVAATPGGTAINTSGTQSGVQTFTSAASISAFDTIQAGTERVLEFGSVLTIAHNATSLILPVGENIVTAVGDVAAFRSEGSGNWRLTDYTPATTSPRFATGPQALGGVDATHALTAAALASVQAIAPKGYITFPGGLILQWGISGSITTGGTEAETFALMFPTAVYGVFLQASTGPGGGDNMPYPAPVATTGFTINNRLSYTATFYWFALGK